MGEELGEAMNASSDGLLVGRWGEWGEVEAHRHGDDTKDGMEICPCEDLKGIGEQWG